MIPFLPVENQANDIEKSCLTFRPISMCVSKDKTSIHYFSFLIHFTCVRIDKIELLFRYPYPTSNNLSVKYTFFSTSFNNRVV